MLSGPLTQQLNLFCSDNRHDMYNIARVLEALSRAMPLLEQTRSVFGSLDGCIGVTATSAFALNLQDPSVQWPYILRQQFPGAEISQPWGFSRPVYLVREASLSFLQLCAQILTNSYNQITPQMNE